MPYPRAQDHLRNELRPQPGGKKGESAPNQELEEIQRLCHEYGPESSQPPANLDVRVRGCATRARASKDLASRLEDIGKEFLDRYTDQ